MSKIYSVQVDAETAALIEADRDALSIQAGHLITPSLYLRGLLSARIRQEIDPFKAGWREGFKSGYSDFMRAIKKAINGLEASSHDDQIFERARRIGAIGSLNKVGDLADSQDLDGLLSGQTSNHLTYPHFLAWNPITRASLQAGPMGAALLEMLPPRVPTSTWTMPGNRRGGLYERWSGTVLPEFLAAFD